MSNRFGGTTSLTEIAVPLGAPAFVTTPVGVDVAEPEPSALVAFTVTRNVLPTSTLFKTYVLLVAPEMSEQLPPVLSHRRHWYVKVIG